MVRYGVASDGRFGYGEHIRLAYRSEAESIIDRKSHKLEASRGENGEKPKWMRWRTFEWICVKLDGADQAWALMASARFGPLMGRT